MKTFLGIAAVHVWLAAWLYACGSTLWGNLAEKTFVARNRPALRSWLMPGWLGDKKRWIKFQKFFVVFAFPLILFVYVAMLLQLIR